MNYFVQPKKFSSKKFNKYLEHAKTTNQFTNNGYAVKMLEHRARKMLGIEANKAVIATSSGSAALHTIISTLSNKAERPLRIGTQDFTFMCNKQGTTKDAKVVDIDNNQQIRLEDMGAVDVAIVTNCFGHLQDLTKVLDYGKATDTKIVFDNANTPYSFWLGTNSCNLGVASFISLHHTKPIGFGEGGLLVIDNEYESIARKVINFGIGIKKEYKEGSNYKMSELAAAGILQWWDQFNIDILRKRYQTEYKKQLEKQKVPVKVFKHNGNIDTFFPSCLPVIHYDNNAFINRDPEVKKYYKPLVGLHNSTKLYDSILCLPIARKIYAKNSSNNWMRRIFR